MPEPSLSCESVTVDLGGRRILDDLSFTAAPGRVTALLGPNGAGKTTTIRCCTGLLRPGSGRVRVLGGWPGEPGVAARVGLMPQSTGAWSGVRPAELLAYLASLYARPQPVAGLVEALGLGDFTSTPYRRLSGGQKQLVNLAGALVGLHGTQRPLARERVVDDDVVGLVLALQVAPGVVVYQHEAPVPFGARDF